MQVFINGKPLQAAAGITLAGLLAQLQIAPRSCATAVNGHFVARDARDQCMLTDDDHITTFEPITGG
jgi:sulfur carrier protein